MTPIKSWEQLESALKDKALFVLERKMKTYSVPQEIVIDAVNALLRQQVIKDKISKKQYNKLRDDTWKVFIQNEREFASSSIANSMETYGTPIDLVEDIAKEEDLKLDHAKVYALIIASEIVKFLPHYSKGSWHV